MKFVLIILVFSSYSDAGAGFSQVFNNYNACNEALVDMQKTNWRKLGNSSFVLLKCYPLGEEK